MFKLALLGDHTQGVNANMPSVCDWTKVFAVVFGDDGSVTRQSEFRTQLFFSSHQFNTQQGVSC